MALITCKDCKKQFSTDAKACPNCGAKPPGDLPIFKIAFGVLFGLLVFRCASIGGGGTTSGTPTAPAATQTAEQRRASELATKQKVDRERTECISQKQAQEIAYKAAWNKRRYGDAAGQVRSCAELTGDPDLQTMLDAAEIADLKDSANNKSASAGSRIVALDVLARRFPEAFKGNEDLYSRLSKQSAAG